MVIKHGTADCFFVLCWNAAILSFHFILTKFQIKGNYLLGHCIVPVSLKVSFQSTCDLLILMCKVSNRSSVLCFTKRHEEQGRWRKRLGENLSEVFQEIKMLFCGNFWGWEWNDAMFYPFLHLFANWTGIYSDLAMLCYYKVFYFRTLLAICLISLHLRHQ